MSKTYITFGQAHVHRVNGKTFDCDCIAVINCKDGKEGRELAIEYFDDKWSFEYFEKIPDMSFFPRGLIKVN